MIVGEARSGIIIGLDTSLLRTAYAIIRDDELLAFSTIFTQEGLADRRDAWKMIRDEARRIERITHEQTRAIVIEDAWLGPNRQGSLNHARCIGHAEALSASCPNRIGRCYVFLVRVRSRSCRMRGAS